VAFSENSPNNTTGLATTVSPLNIFYTVQLLLFCGIIFLAVFKFN